MGKVVINQKLTLGKAYYFVIVKYIDTYHGNMYLIEDAHKMMFTV